MKFLVLGDGLLGKEIVSQTECDFISRKKDGFDVSSIDLMMYHEEFKKYDTIINCIAHTKTYSNEFEMHMNVNCKFLDKLIDYCNENNKKLVHISTDYIYTNSVSESSETDVPVHISTWYGYSKLVGDAMVQIRSKNYLICRLSHKPNPFPYNNAWVDIKTNGDLVNKIAELVIQLILKNATGVFNVGTNVKSIYDMVKHDFMVEPSLRPEGVPKDTSMNISKLKNFL